MPLIALQQPVTMPIGPMREFLGKALPGYKWRCGEDDEGGPKDRSGLDRPQTILGMAGGEVAMMVIERVDGVLPFEAGAPPHHAHLKLSEPGIEDIEQGKRMAIVVAASLMMQQDDGAHCQFASGGNWYSTEEMGIGLAMCTAARGGAEMRADDFFQRYGERSVSAAAGSAPASPLAPASPIPDALRDLQISGDLGKTFAKVLTDMGGADFARQMGHAPPPPYAEERSRADRLPTMVIALGGALTFDWSPLVEAFRLFDEGGEWRIDGRADGSGTISGRHGTIRLELAEPIPAYLIEDALTRSFWFRDGLAPFARQTGSLVVTCDMDTRGAPFEQVRDATKAITLMLGLLTRNAQAIALFNAGISTVMAAAMVQEQVGHLHKNQIPVMLWTWTAWHSMTAGAVSFSTGGLLPFLGFELEAWNAPNAAEWVGDKASNVINYLLHVGPAVIGDGNSFGESAGDRSIRGFFGESRAGRPDTTRVLLLEFDGGPAKPAPDPVPRRPGGFGLFGRKQV